MRLCDLQDNIMEGVEDPDAEFEGDAAADVSEIITRETDCGNPWFPYETKTVSPLFYSWIISTHLTPFNYGLRSRLVYMLWYSPRTLPTIHTCDNAPFQLIYTRFPFRLMAIDTIQS